MLKMWLYGDLLICKNCVFQNLLWQWRNFELYTSLLIQMNVIELDIEASHGQIDKSVLDIR